MSGRERERIFLYGTLRRGGSRDVLSHYEGVEFVCAARVRGLLYDLGSYPGLRLAEGAGWVHGEIFNLSKAALAGLDEWEGLDSENPDRGEYRRIFMTVELAGKAEQICWGYEIQPAFCEGRPIIVSGDWIAHAALRG